MPAKKREKNKQARSLLSFVLIFIMTISSVVIIYVAVFGNDKSVFGYRLFTVLTSSMGETIKKDALIITKKVAQEELYEGEIITFISSDPSIKGEVNTHRIFRIVNDVIYTKGDGNNYVDKATVKYEDIIGRVAWHSIVVGKTVKFLQKPQRLLLFVILPLGIFTFVDFHDVLEKIKLFKKSQNRKPKRAARLKKVDSVFVIKMRKL